MGSRYLVPVGQEALDTCSDQSVNQLGSSRSNPIAKLKPKESAAIFPFPLELLQSAAFAGLTKHESARDRKSRTIERENVDERAREEQGRVEPPPKENIRMNSMPQSR